MHPYSRIWWVTEFTVTPVFFFFLTERSDFNHSFSDIAHCVFLGIRSITRHKHGHFLALAAAAAAAAAWRSSSWTPEVLRLQRLIRSLVVIWTWGPQSAYNLSRSRLGTDGEQLLSRWESLWQFGGTKRFADRWLKGHRACMWRSDGGHLWPRRRWRWHEVR